MMVNLLKSRMLQSLIRHAITGIGTVLVAKGVLEPELASQLSTTISGLVLGAIGLAWSGKDKRETVEITAVNESSLKGQSLEPVYYDDSTANLTVSWDGTPEGFSKLMRDNPYLKPRVYSNYQNKDIDPEPVRSESEIAQESSGFMLSDRSREAMAGINPLLANVVETALELTEIDFAVTEGMRSPARQQELIRANKSWVKKSKHEDGNAIDIAAFPNGYKDCSWDLSHYAIINKAFQEAARRHNVRITWGGHWAQRDGVHFQLDSETVKLNFGD